MGTIVLVMDGFEYPVTEKLKQGTPVFDREVRQALAAFKEGNSLG